MSEANYPEVQLQINFTDDTILAQTFTPLVSYDTYYASVKLQSVGYAYGLEVALQYTTPEGWPTGTDLDKQFIGGKTLGEYSEVIVHLCKFNHVRLVAGTEYALVLRGYPRPEYHLYKASYEAPPGHYPRGKLIKSSNAGSTWDTTDLGDLFFAVWGDPPVPPSPAPPPLINFAILDYSYLPFDLGLIIRIPTNVPSHLTCYWTDKVPLKHHRSRTIRGFAVPWGTYFCFVAWHAVEQLEYGCTLYHTFVLPNWKVGEKRWFTFRATIDLLDSPSVGPIFEQTNPGQTLIKNPSFELFTDPPNAPDLWTGGGPPGQPPIFYPDPISKTHGTQSCRATVSVLYSLQRLYQYLEPTLLSNIQLSFRCSYNGALEWRNTMRVRAWGDTIRLELARPTLDYQWEDLTLTITMPDNLYQLELSLTIDNQGQPVPWHAWWDNLRLYIGTPP